MKTEIDSPWKSHMDIAIRCWSRARAREMADKASKAANMEDFLGELLTDALRTFNRESQQNYEQHIHQLERLLDDAMGVKLAPSIFLSTFPLADSAASPKGDKS